MAYRRMYLKFVKDDNETYLSPADNFTGCVITDGDELTLNFKAQDGTADADLIKLHLQLGPSDDNPTLGCRHYFKDFCRALAGALSGSSLHKGVIEVANHETNVILPGSKLSLGATPGTPDSITSITVAA